MTAELTMSLRLATPELILAVAAMALLMVGVFSGKRANDTVSGLAVAVLVAAGAWLILFPINGEAFGGSFVSDPFARFMKVVTLAGSLVTLVMSIGFAKAEKFDRFEYPVLIILATLGMMLMISANDMIAVYLGLELQSLALYVVAAMNRVWTLMSPVEPIMRTARPFWSKAMPSGELNMLPGVTFSEPP